MPLIDVTYDGTVGEEVLRRLEAARLPAVPGELAHQHRADQTAPDRRTGPKPSPSGPTPKGGHTVILAPQERQPDSLSGPMSARGQRT